MLSLSTIATSALLGASAIGGGAGAPAQPHHVCKLAAHAPYGIGADLLGNPAFEIGAKLDCGTAARRNNVRMCPQQLISGTWQFVTGSGGWSTGSGTCRDATWWTSLGTAMTSQFAGMPGQNYRTWAESWISDGGAIRRTVTVSTPYSCC